MESEALEALARFHRKRTRKSLILRVMGIVVDEMADCRLNVYYSRYNYRKKKRKESQQTSLQSQIIKLKISKFVNSKKKKSNSFYNKEIHQ